MRPASAVLASSFLLLGACQTLTYDLTAVPVPVSARPAAAGERAGEPFSVTAKNVLWIHGLAGHDQPDVAALLAEAAVGSAGVADFRVTMGASFHDWLLSHLTLGFVRIKTVTVSGTRLQAAP